MELVKWYRPRLVRELLCTLMPAVGIFVQSLLVSRAGGVLDLCNILGSDLYPCYPARAACDMRP